MYQVLLTSVALGAFQTELDLFPALIYRLRPPPQHTLFDDPTSAIHLPPILHIHTVSMSTILSIILLTPLFLILTFLNWYLHLPSTLPRLPVIPIYVSILGLWSSMGQDEVYERWFRAPLEKHGAALVWFAGRWSVLVSRPDWLTDIFRNEHLYAKAGSQVKIPHAVIATLVGDNIINAHGDNWKLYTGIMKPGLQKKVFDTAPLLNRSRQLVQVLIDEQRRVGENVGICVNADVQKWAVDVMGENFLDLDLKVRCLFPGSNCVFLLDWMG